MTAIQSTWQAGFLSVLPTVKAHARIQFRKLAAHEREDAVQEAIASACASYQRLAAKGQLHTAHASTLAKYAVNFVRSGRHVGGNTKREKHEEGHPCFLKGGVNLDGSNLPLTSDCV
jgi:DNA-directed RNA polymerase specialized sigma24 family protein